MGMTHYWKRPTELPVEPFLAAVGDWCKVCEAAGVALGGLDGTGVALADSEHIVFNGAAPNSCEPFELARVEFDRRGRSTVTSFCKASGLPYGFSVRATLIIFQHHLPEYISVTSDSDSGDEEWVDARSLVESVLGYGGSFRLQSNSE